MANSQELSVVIFILFVGGILAEPDLSICDPANNSTPGTNPPLPQLPRQYQLQVEATISNKGYSFVLQEYYDEINNRGASVSTDGNFMMHTSYDYRHNQSIRVSSYNGSKPTCRVGDLTKGFSLFGFHVENGTGHINGTDSVFRFGKEFNETFIEMVAVRGIPAQHWQRCVYFEGFNETYLLDFYFSDAGFKTAYSRDQVPLRATINGSGVNRTTGERRTFSHNYEYFDLKPGPVDIDRAFEPPLGVSCPGRKSFKKFPAFPDVFGVNVESVIPSRKSVHFTREYYNYKAKLVAYIFSPWSNSTGGQNKTLVREVHDFNAGLAYKMQLDTGVCSIGPIPVHSFFRDTDSLDGKHVSLRSPYNFLLHGNHTWVYEGNTTLREIEAEAWITEEHSIPFWVHDPKAERNATMEYFFSRGNWSGDSGLGGMTHDMPLRFQYSASMKFNNSFHTFDMTQNMFHFNYHIPFHEFDVHTCFDESDSKYLSVDIVGIDQYENFVVNNTHVFYPAAQLALANASGLPASRIANLNAIEGEDEVLIIFFEMLGIPPVIGNAVNVSSQPSLADAYAKLQTRVADAANPIAITFPLHGQTTLLSIAPDSLRAKFKPVKEESNGNGLGVGAAVGLAIAMFVVGAVFASCLAFLYVRRMMDAPVPYNVQS